MREHSSVVRPALPWRRNSLEIEKEKKGCGQRGRRPGSPLSIFERTREPLSTRVKEAAFETWPPLSVVHRRLGIVLPSSVSLAFPPSDWIFPSKKGGRYFIVIEVRGVFFFFPLPPILIQLSNEISWSLVFQKLDHHHPSFEKNRNPLSIKNPPSNCHPSRPSLRVP